MKAGWEEERLGDLCYFKNGLWKGKKEPFVHVGVIRNTNFTKNGQLDDSDIAYLDVESKQYLSRKLEFGDLILEKSGGGPIQAVGRIIPFEKREGEFSFSNFTSVIRVKDFNEVYYAYLHRYLHFLYISGTTEKMQKHSTGIRNLQLKEYKEVNVPLPSLPEQKSIVAILDEAFAGIATATANAEKNLNNARELFESYLNTVFTEKDEGWVEKTLGDIANFKNGLNFTKNSKGEWIKIVGVKDFKSNYWIPMEELNVVQIEGILSGNYVLKENDILTVRSNGNKQLIGRCILAKDVPDKTSHSGFTIRIRICSSNVVPAYLVHYLKSGYIHEILISSGGGVNISSLNQETLSSLPVFFPKRNVYGLLLYSNLFFWKV